MDVSLSVTGLDSLVRQLKGIPDKVRTRGIRRALDDGAIPVVMQAKMRAPVDTGGLRDSIDRRHRNYRRGEFQMVVIGPAWPEGAHGHLVERGTKERPRQKVNKYARMFAEALGAEFGTTGKMPAQPFLRPAADATREHSKMLIATSLKTFIETQAAKR